MREMEFMSTPFPSVPFPSLPASLTLSYSTSRLPHLLQPRHASERIKALLWLGTLQNWLVTSFLKFSSCDKIRKNKTDWQKYKESTNLSKLHVPCFPIHSHLVLRRKTLKPQGPQVQFPSSQTSLTAQRTPGSLSLSSLDALTFSRLRRLEYNLSERSSMRVHLHQHNAH